MSNEQYLRSLTLVRSTLRRLSKCSHIKVLSDNRQDFQMAINFLNDLQYEKYPESGGWGKYELLDDWCDE